ncbi:hypothetical protein OIDMADRAFT_36548 [Oidiodendron maius Zn]|uniref:Uncharacterized protein n=1 Tax=Oidiodendron maius (strain Zn) TaxID=913774 RepID=A0A0C3GLM2_OIDMZ|nr:hypothetical protein OIDMADRAFT_36548 [Oidiodendron maius Zn]
MAEDRCRWVSYTEYIELAKTQLAPAEFATTLESIYKKFPPKGEYTALQAYLEPALAPVDAPAIPMPRPALAAIFNPTGPPVTLQPVLTLLKKRKQRRESSMPHVLDLPEALRLLSELQNISKMWDNQYRMLLIFLASLSPPQPTPLYTTLPWSLPSLALQPVPSSDDNIVPG